jgi:hypothetical protein
MNGEDFYTPSVPEPRIGMVVAPAPETTCAVVSLQLAGIAPDPSWFNPRLAVVWWHQRGGEPDEFMQVAYDIPLGTESDITISLDQLKLPYEENLVCFRDCRDRSKCPCTEPPAIALGSITVAQDTNGDGTLSLAELKTEQLSDAPVLIGWSDAALESVSPTWQSLFDVVAGGPCPYRYSADPDDLYRLVPVDSVEMRFDVQTCPANDPSCSFAVPEPFCAGAECGLARGLNRLGLQ